MKSEGYDINKILRKFAEYENIDDLQDFHQTTIDINKTKLDDIIKTSKNSSRTDKFESVKTFQDSTT